MNWTAEYPTQPGVYWIRNYALNIPDWHRHSGVVSGPRIVELDAYGEWFLPGFDVGRDYEDTVSAEWFGPIQPPQENDNVRR